MTQLFEIKEIEGKGLGWVATKNIKRGTVIFTEKPQLELNCCSEEQMKSGNRVSHNFTSYMYSVDLTEFRCYFFLINSNNLELHSVV